MKLFFHQCTFGFSNCYVLGEENAHGGEQSNAPQNASQNTARPADAVIVDPGTMDDQLLERIENNNFNVRAVLVTHDHLFHVRGLRTLKRIFNAEIFAINQHVQDHTTTMVRDGDTINIGPFTVGVLSIPGHSADSAVYVIDHLLFTGDALTAGMVGTTASAYGATTQMNKLRSRLLSLPGDYVVLPGHGPPSTLEAERRFNAGIIQYDEHRNRRPVFKVDL